MITKEHLLAKLAQLQIPYTLFEHEPLRTVEEARSVVAELKMPGVGIKNLFLKDSKKNLYLISACDNTVIKLKEVGKKIGAPELRFADPALLKEYLGVEPGSVTPLALINDTHKKVTAIFDAHIFTQPLIQVHPLENTATVVITPADLKKFMEHIQHAWTEYHF